MMPPRGMTQRTGDSPRYTCDYTAKTASQEHCVLWILRPHPRRYAPCCGRHSAGTRVGISMGRNIQTTEPRNSLHHLPLLNFEQSGNQTVWKWANQQSIL